MNPSTFEMAYADVSSEQRERLKAFRVDHPAKFLDVDGKRWRYIACGCGEKTLLFLAGAFLPADMWFYPITELEKSFRILAPDTNMLVGLSARQALDALPRLMDTEGVQKTSVIGLSAGGGMAQMLLQEYPERIDDLVLSHTGVIESQPETETQLRRLIWLVRLMPIALVRRVILKKTGGTLPVSSKWRQFHDAFFRESSAAISKDMVVSFLQNALQLRREYRYEPETITRWQGRTIILNSRDDLATMGSLDKLKQRFPGALVHLFEEGGHHTFMLYPEAYTAALKEFLNSVRGIEIQALTEAR
ncbi:MAG: alpha/beta hydrolase [Anaerolineae bacterium]|nr:alpha/beta hydrolase [Anaerolineae bacterium]